MFDPGKFPEVSHGIADLDVRECTDDELLDATTTLGTLRSLIEVTEAHLLAELDVRAVTDREHGMRTAAWAAAATGKNRGPINNRLRVGRALRDHFNVIDHAVSERTLSFEHAKALVGVTNPRVTDALASAQDQIIALAQGTTFDRWKNDVAALVEHADTEGVEPDPYEGNEIRLPKTLDGRTEIFGTLDAANGLILRTALNAKADELFRRFTRDHETTPEIPVPGRNTLRALALIELLRTAQAREPGTGVAPRAEVTLVLHNHEIFDTDGVPLPRAAADIWGCDPEMWAVVVDDMGLPVDVGHTKRLATVAQRHAISVRDGGCTFPGCDAPIDWCDCHHAKPWDHDGPTDIANLVALCRHHHGVAHRTDWAMRLDNNQRPIWTTPNGRTFTGQRHHRKPDLHEKDHPEPDTRHPVIHRSPHDGSAPKPPSPPPPTSPPPRPPPGAAHAARPGLFSVIAGR